MHARVSLLVMNVKRLLMHKTMVRPICFFSWMVMLIGICWPVSAQSQSPYYPNNNGYYDNNSGYGNNNYYNNGNNSYNNSNQGNSLLDSGSNRRSRQSDSSSSSSRTSRRNRTSDKNAAKTTDTKKEGAQSNAEKAAGDTGPGKKESKSRSGSGSGVHTIGAGKSKAGGGAATAKGPEKGGDAAGAPAKPAEGGAAAALAAAAKKAAGKAPGGAAGAPGAPGAAAGAGSGFEPVLEREVAYGDVPDVGEPLTLEGPMAVGEFLAAINLATNWNILVSPELEEVQLRFWLSETKPKDALQILKFHRIYYEYDQVSKFLQVMSEEEYLTKKFGKRKPFEFHVKDIDVSLAESVISSLLSGVGTTLTDQRTKTVYVWDTEDNIAEMQRILEEVDVPQEEAEFKVQYAEVADMEAILSSMLSSSGNLVSDVRTGQIFVWDNATALSQMKVALERLDKPVESQTFALKYINAEDVTDSLESLITERGMVQVDPRTNSLIVTDLPPRIAKIGEVIAALDKELETRTWIIKYADLDFIADEIESLIPSEMGTITVDDMVHQITVKGLSERLDEVDKLIQKWDIKRKQVLIEAYIVECSDDVERAFNVNWSYYGSVLGQPAVLHSNEGSSSTNAASGSGEAMQVGRLPYAIPMYGALQLDSSGKIVRPQLTDVNGKPIIERYAGNKLAATLDYLDKRNKATILSSPRVTVQDGEEATFENATRVPYVSASTYYGGYNYNSSSSYYNGVNNTNRVDFVDVGTILSVYPRITEDSNILLDISAEDSTYKDKDIKVNDQTSTIPEKTARRADTQLRVNSGETVVLGGLRRDRASHSENRTPLLSDLPGLGWLFRSPSRSSESASLLIFITTTIVDEDSSSDIKELVHAQDEITKNRRHSQKDFWNRMRANFGDMKEMIVAVGPTGQIYCEGEASRVDDVTARIREVKKPASTQLVLRLHPEAPKDLVNAMVEAAMEVEMKVVYDNELPPILPKSKQAKADAPKKEEKAASESAALVPADPPAEPVTGDAPAAVEAAPLEAVPSSDAAPAPAADAPAPAVPAADAKS